MECFFAHFSFFLLYLNPLISSISVTFYLCLYICWELLSWRCQCQLKELGRKMLCAALHYPFPLPPRLYLKKKYWRDIIWIWTQRPLVHTVWSPVIWCFLLLEIPWKAKDNIEQFNFRWSLGCKNLDHEILGAEEWPPECLLEMLVWIVRSREAGFFC